jgi:hypothetical protein
MPSQDVPIWTEVPQNWNLNPLPSKAKHGLIAISFFSLLSVLVTGGLLTFLTYRIIRWKKYYTSYIGHNQYLVLLYCLFLSDFIQAFGFLISLHWLKEDAITAGTAACNAQGWLVQLGDLSMAVWVFALAIHSFFAVVRGRHFSFVVFCCGIGLGWLFCIILSISGPLSHRQGDFFVRTASWVRLQLLKI